MVTFLFLSVIDITALLLHPVVPVNSRVTLVDTVLPARRRPAVRRGQLRQGSAGAAIFQTGKSRCRGFGRKT